MAGRQPAHLRAGTDLNEAASDENHAPDLRVAPKSLGAVRADYDVADEEIRDRFGSRVADAVDAMTKCFRGATRDPCELFDRIAADPLASVAKGPDRIHNLHTAYVVFSADKIDEYVAETETYFLPTPRVARTRHTRQEPVYENLRFVLSSQVQLLRAVAASL